MKVRITYTVEQYGSMQGMPCLEFAPGGKNKYTFEELHDVVISTMSYYNMRFKYIVINTLDSSFPDRELGDVVQFIDWAFINGIHIAHNVGGIEKPSYLRMGGLVRVFISNDQWLKFPANEIFWEPEDPTDLREPALAEYEGIPRFLVVSKDLSLQTAMEFITQEAQKTWVLSLPPKQNVRVVI